MSSIQLPYPGGKYEKSRKATGSYGNSYFNHTRCLPLAKGTWRFRSEAILYRSTKQHGVVDDRELAYHVWNSLCTIQSITKSTACTSLQRCLVNLDEFYTGGSVPKGELNKRSYVMTVESCPNQAPTCIHSLKNLGKFSCSTCHLKQADYDRLEQPENKIRTSEKNIRETDTHPQEISAGVSPTVPDLKLALRDVHLALPDPQLAAQDSETMLGQ